MSYRDMTCGEARLDDAGRTLTLSGWVGRRRDHGGLIFVDLRDRSGAVQLVIDPERSPEAHAVAHRLRLEEVIRVRGELVPRSEGTRNPALATGDVELSVSAAEVLAPSEPLPFQLDEEGVDETLRIHHRYLDLRRPAMQRIQKIRVDVTRIMRRYLEDRGFWELETPMLTRSTPEGARDFLVPARLDPGAFYALPQSPQLFKQLLMCAGYERYYQIARCFRDEAQRADRQLEFTQLDFEMSFVEREEVLAVVEGLYGEIWKQILGVEIELPFPRLSYHDAMRRYGSDKPDLRYGLEIGDVSEAVKGSAFGVFRSAVEAGGIVRALAVPGVSVTRKDIDELQAFAKEWGGKGLAHLIFEPDGELRSPILKFLSEAEVAAIREATGAEPGSVVFLAADAEPIVNRVLGALRAHLAERFDLIDRSAWRFLYVVDFPLFKQDEETGGWGAEHHMFTAPIKEHEGMLESDPGAVISEAYDMVLNGLEMASGSIRINRPDLQQRVFDVVGFERADAEERFGFLLRALRFGAPPHGGMAPGLDRTVMLLAGTDNLREVIAFPKTGGGYDPLTGAPAPVEATQLGELGLTVRPKPAPAKPQG
ncbi:MAG TPA: aspartate--tRNA ligase [Gaiellales bacterium]